MAYTAPYIDDTGCHTNSYSDILNYYIDGVKAIYGDDIYLEVDSMDYQLLSIFARAIYEEEQCAQMNYQARSPVTASTRDALDALVTINGLKSKAASKSTANVTLTGTPYTLIQGGVIQSLAGDKWDLPESVTIGSNGTISVVATAQELGSIAASANTITRIVTPTYGWTSVTNEYQASVGQPVETMIELKERQQATVATPSQTPKAGISSAIYNIEGVTNFVVYENDTSSAKEYDTSTKEGGPANSVTCVIEGGDDYKLAQAIDLRKTPGCYLAGDIVIPISDSFGSQNNIRFYRPENKATVATFNIKALLGYSTEVGEQIKEAVVNYLSKLGISDNLYLSQLWEAALSVSPDIKPYFSLRSVTQGVISELKAATGYIDLLQNLDLGDTITIGSTDLVAGSDFNIGDTVEETATTISEIPVQGVTLSVEGTRINIVASEAGSAGNNIALSTNAPDIISLSSSHLTSGSDATSQSAQDLIADFNTKFYTEIEDITINLVD